MFSKAIVIRMPYCFSYNINIRQLQSAADVLAKKNTGLNNQIHKLPNRNGAAKELSHNIPNGSIEREIGEEELSQDIINGAAKELSRNAPNGGIDREMEEKRRILEAAGFAGFNPTTNAPGPAPSDATMGNLLDVPKVGSLHQYLGNIHSEHGSIVSFWWGKTHAVSVTSDALHHIRKMKKKPHIFFDSARPLLGDNSIQYSNDEDFESRKIGYVTPAFGLDTILKIHYNNFKQIIQELIQNLSVNSCVHSVHDLTMELAIRSAQLNIFGIESEDKHTATKLFKAYVIIWDYMEKSIGTTLPTEEETKIYERELKFFKETIKSLVVRRKELNFTEKRCFLDHLVDHLKQGKYTEDYIVDELSSFFTGGFHTTGNLLTWIFYYLAANEPVQEKILQEISQMNIDDTPARKFKYIEAVIKETLRMCILAPFAGRFSSNDEKLGDFDVKANTPIILAIGYTSVDPRFWSDADKFKPERFLESSPESKNKFYPFGLGFRVCPGMSYTYHFNTLLIYNLVKNFKLKLEDTAGTPEKIFLLITKPDRTIKVNFEKRS